MVKQLQEEEEDMSGIVLFSFSFFFLSGTVLLLNVHPVSLVTCSAFCFIR